MERQREAVSQILRQISQSGLEWYRKANLEEGDILRRRTSEKYSLLDKSEIWLISTKPAGNFSQNKILVIEPNVHEADPFVGVWLKWDFSDEQAVFSLFLGMWSVISRKKTFVAFRYEAPETGEEHDFFHCQPCRNFGDKIDLPEAALISDRFPTIPLNASNIVELTVCALMSTLGRKKAKNFLKGMLKDSDAASNEFLVAAFSRCCKDSYVTITGA